MAQEGRALMVGSRRAVINRRAEKPGTPDAPSVERGLLLVAQAGVADASRAATKIGPKRPRKTPATEAAGADRQRFQRNTRRAGRALGRAVRK